MESESYREKIERKAFFECWLGFQEGYPLTVTGLNKPSDNCLEERSLFPHAVGSKGGPHGYKKRVHFVAQERTF